MDETPSRRDGLERVRRNLEQGRLEESAGRPDQAARYYHRILQNDPDHTEANRRLANLATAEDDFLQAERHLRAALEGTPDEAALWAMLARCHAARDRPEQARLARRRAAELSSGMPIARVESVPTPDQMQSAGYEPSPSREIIRTARNASPEPRRTDGADGSDESPAAPPHPRLPCEFLEQARRDDHAATPPDAPPGHAAVSTTAQNGNLPLWDR